MLLGIIVFILVIACNNFDYFVQDLQTAFMISAIALLISIIFNLHFEPTTIMANTYQISTILNLVAEIRFILNFPFHLSAK